VAIGALESVLPPTRWGDGPGPVAMPPDGRERALSALEHAVASGRGLVLLDGPEGAGKSAALRELAGRLAASYRVLVLGGEARAREPLSHLVLATLGAGRTGDPEPLVALEAERLRERGRPLVLLVDDADALPDDAVRWLARLAEPPEALARVVLAAREYTGFLVALGGLGICVDLVRLGPAATAGPEARARPAAERGAELEPEPEWEREREPAAVAEQPHDGLLTIEELLGDAELPLFDPSQPAPADARPETTEGTGVRPLVLPAASPPAARRALEPPPPRPEPAAAPLRSAPRPSVRAAPEPAPRVRWQPARGVLAALLAACVAVAAITWLASPARRDPRTPPVSAAPPAPAAAERAAVVAEPTRRAASARSGSGSLGAPQIETARTPGAVVVSDLQQALDLLADGRASDSRAEVLGFLRAHGPDAAGYALLDELDSRHPRGPEEAVELLTARSRVRATLCAAWSDDVRGEAPERLGCPGAAAAQR